MMTEANPSGASGAFDMEAYAAKYSGRNRIDRLLFIANRGVSEASDMQQQLPQQQLQQSPEQTPAVPAINDLELQQEALVALLKDLKDGININLYLEIAERCQQLRLGEDLMLDHNKIEAVKRSCAQRHERLVQELSSYKSSLIKESIRMGHNDLGDFYYQVGDLNLALKSFAQARDYCTTDKHIVDMCFNVIKVAVPLNNFVHVANYLGKLEQVASNDTDPVLKSKISATFGLVAMQERSFYQAACKFIECQIDIGGNFSEVIHAEDIALYGGICALACFKREDLKEKVINNTSFKAFLEFVPWLRELISDFCSSKYAGCLETLDQKRPELLLDMYLSKYVDELFREIRHRAMVQFFYPYLSVNLHQMAQAFRCPVDALESELGQLIKDNKLQARIDGFRKVLLAHDINYRQKAYELAHQVGTKVAAESQILLLRANLVKNNLMVHE